MKELFIKPKVSDEFLLLQGQFITTWAHLEFALWEILLTTKSPYLETPAEMHDAYLPSAVTAELHKQLDRAIATNQLGDASDVQSILDDMKTQKLSRDMAVHGAWRQVSADTVRCEYHKNFGTKAEPDWSSYSIPIDREEIEAALTSADELLRRAATALRRRLPMEGG
ncbi:hypothetical protein FDP22_19970 (plasmid) [Paroceanicella profunda]|uniref:Uncharacterized protein n=1 Tax=Paroceanicella profunda TaxID=2579971 RepID=A0A5B8FJ78_9RHOB|nr:hypothetical protein [Paroceanicella profunda]QDL94137.1 hypothetical protein FDP22_19970 [Paroceanicella profunda]